MIYIISHSHNGMPNEKINDILAREEKYHANMVEYHRFFQNAADIRSELKYILARLKSEGYRIAAYGAAAKGNVLLNFCGIDTELLILW